MALPSGPIDFGSLTTLVGSDASAYGYSASLAWVRANTKDGISDMGDMEGRDWYQSSMGGNCSNGNCTQSDCNCGSKNCPNCLNCSAVNCANCDTQKYLQADCNCNCTYNCTQSTRSYNCDCDCFVCNCW